MSAPKKHWRGGLFPKKLSECLSGVLKPALDRYGAAEARLLTHWPQVVGPVLAKVTMPQKVSMRPGGGTLALMVQTGWATEIQHQEHTIIEKIAAFFGYRAIDRITLQQVYVLPGQEEKPAPRNLKRPSDSPPPAILDEVADPELRAVLTSLAAAMRQPKE